MAYPSDYRYNPFNDVSTAILAIERHIIPATSPYVISLNEVPQKNSPSTMTVKEITDVSGDTVTYGSTFAEVSANPASGEFWSDYNTGADGDKGWNTGKLLFNAADAGKMVEVTYTATGTLAGVKSNRFPAWWLDRGDGSDGDFVPTENTTIRGVKNYKSVFIKAGITVTVDKYVLIKCHGIFVNKGNITANGKGAAGGTEYNNGNNGIGAGVGGAAGNASQQGGGAGGAATYNGFAITVTEDMINLFVNNKIWCYGAGGGASGRNSNGVLSPGGNGGGCIHIVSGSFDNMGTISSNGTYQNNGGANPGGGGGGAVVVISEIINTQGTITASGANGAGNGWTKIIDLGVL